MSLIIELAESHLKYAKSVASILHHIVMARKVVEQQSGINDSQIPTACYAGGDFAVLWSQHVWASKSVEEYKLNSPDNIISAHWHRNGDQFDGSGFVVTYRIPVIMDINHVFGKPYIEYRPECTFVPNLVFLQVMSECKVQIGSEGKDYKEIYKSSALKEWVEADIVLIEAVIKDASATG